MKKLFISEDIPKSTEELLTKEGFFAVRLKKEKDLPLPVSSHADMLIFSDAKKLITTKKYYDSNKTVFDTSNVLTVNAEFGNIYPKDVIFNAFTVNGTLFGKTDSLCEELTSLYDKKIHLSQGYAKCSVLIFGSNAITADKGIYKALDDFGIRCLLTEPGHILLPGYSYGFIGGASFSYDDKVFFFGDITSHPDSERILGFIKEAGYTVLFDKSIPLTDFGGAVIDKSLSL